MFKIIPFGNRILVKRRQIGGKIGKDSVLYAPDSVKDRDTDLADVVYVPDHSFADAELINNSDAIIEALVNKAKTGDSDALKALLDYNIFLKIKSISVGDGVFISKYVGTTFHDNQGGDDLTLVALEDVIGLVIDDTQETQDANA